MEDFLLFTDLDESKTNPFVSPYLKTSRELQGDSSVERLRQAHLLKSARLNTSTSLTPQPPCIFGLQIMSHETQVIRLQFSYPI